MSQDEESTLFQGLGGDGFAAVTGERRVGAELSPRLLARHPVILQSVHAPPLLGVPLTPLDKPGRG